MNKKKSLTRYIISAIVMIMAFAGLVMSMMSWLCCLVSPTKLPILQFFGIAFWPILLLNVAMTLLLTIARSKKVLVSLLALLVSVPGLLKSYSFGKSSEGDGIKVMSYNVHIFSDIDGGRNEETFVEDIIKMVRRESPDVLCLQEFSSYINGKSRAYCMRKFAAETGFMHMYYNDENNNLGRNVIFSNYPLTPLSPNMSSNENFVNGIMAEVDAGNKGKFAVADVHLLSFKITDDEIRELLQNSNDGDAAKEIGRSLYQKMSYAFNQRADDVSDMLKALPDSDMPIMVCGDYNDTPVSYVCQNMTKSGFYDTFVKVGHGVGATYLRKLPWLRIDYIWANNRINPLNFTNVDFKGSDHCPVMLEFNVKTN